MPSPLSRPVSLVRQAKSRPIIKLRIAPHARQANIKEPRQQQTIRVTSVPPEHMRRILLWLHARIVSPEGSMTKYHRPMIPQTQPHARFVRRDLWRLLLLNQAAESASRANISLMPSPLSRPVSLVRKAKSRPTRKLRIASYARQANIKEPRQQQNIRVTSVSLENMPRAPVY